MNEKKIRFEQYLINCVCGLNYYFSITNIDVQNIHINQYFIKLENRQYENCYVEREKLQLPIFGERKIKKKRITSIFKIKISKEFINLFWFQNLSFKKNAN